MDPITLSLIAAGGQALAGAGQTLFSGRKRAEKEMERKAQSSPIYGGSKPLEEYYRESLSRYRENPMQSQMYQTAMKEAQRSQSTALNALQDRRMGLAGVGRIQAGTNLAAERAGVNAEQQRNLRFSQLAGATQAKTADELRQFDINRMTPYNRQFGLAQMKAQAANQRQAAGLQTISSALGNLTTGLMSEASSLSPEDRLKMQQQRLQAREQRAKAREDRREGRRAERPGVSGDVVLSDLPQSMKAIKNSEGDLIPMPDMKLPELPKKMRNVDVSEYFDLTPPLDYEALSPLFNKKNKRR